MQSHPPFSGLGAGPATQEGTTTHSTVSDLNINGKIK